MTKFCSHPALADVRASGVVALGALAGCVVGEVIKFGHLADQPFGRLVAVDAGRETRVVKLGYGLTHVLGCLNDPARRQGEGGDQEDCRYC
jgi:hypothetical protein